MARLARVVAPGLAVGRPLPFPLTLLPASTSWPSGARAVAPDATKAPDAHAHRRTDDPPPAVHGGSQWSVGPPDTEGARRAGSPGRATRASRAHARADGAVLRSTTSYVRSSLHSRSYPYFLYIRSTMSSASISRVRLSMIRPTAGGFSGSKRGSCHCSRKTMGASSLSGSI